MDAASKNRRARQKLLSHCLSESDLRAFILDYVPEHLPHIPEQGSLQDKASKLIERAGADRLLRCLEQCAGEGRRSLAREDGLHLGRPTGVFVGRRHELAWLRERLCGAQAAQRTVAVCALQGMAGVGKSYLCDQFFEENRDEFPGGYVVLSLASARQPTVDSLLFELAARLRIDGPLDEQVEAVTARLRQPRTLLHIENVDDEGLGEATAELVRCLPGCAILVSARQQDVGLSARLRWERLPISALSPAEALEQLRQEFREPRTPIEGTQYATLVADVGALPLAIHLVAGRLTQGQRLDSLLLDLTRQVLDRRAADPSERSRQVLRASVLASLHALEESVAADGDPLLPSTAVASALAGLAQGPAAGVGDSLAYALCGLWAPAAEALLVRARGFSLVERIEGAHGVRWRMHPLIAAALSDGPNPLLPEGGLVGLRAWFLARFPEELPGERAASQGANTQAIRDEEPALLHWLDRLPATEAGAVARVGNFYAYTCGPYAAWSKLCRRGLAAAPSAEDRSWLLLTLCQSHQSLGQLDEALAVAETRCELERERGNHKGHAVSLGLIADIHQARGNLDEALRIRRDEALPIYEKLDEVRLRALTLGSIADIEQARGQLDEALRIRRSEELPVYERLGDWRERAVAMGKIADIYKARGDLDEALRIRQQEVLPVYQKVGDLRSCAVTMGKIADIFQTRGQLDEALRLRREEELPVYDKLGDVRERAVSMGKIADICKARGDLDEALRIRRQEALPVYEKLGARRDILVCEANIALILLRRGQVGDTAEAERLLRKALGAALAMRLPEVSTIERILARRSL